MAPALNGLPSAPEFDAWCAPQSIDEFEEHLLGLGDAAARARSLNLELEV